jgi:hypothetical protein
MPDRTAAEYRRPWLCTPSWRSWAPRVARMGPTHATAARAELRIRRGRPARPPAGVLQGVVQTAQAGGTGWRCASWYRAETALSPLPPGPERPAAQGQQRTVPALPVRDRAATTGRRTPPTPAPQPRRSSAVAGRTLGGPSSARTCGLVAAPTVDPVSRLPLRRPAAQSARAATVRCGAGGPGVYVPGLPVGRFVCDLALLRSFAAAVEVV